LAIKLSGNAYRPTQLHLLKSIFAVEALFTTSLKLPLENSLISCVEGNRRQYPGLAMYKKDGIDLTAVDLNPAKRSACQPTKTGLAALIEDSATFTEARPIVVIDDNEDMRELLTLSCRRKAIRSCASRMVKLFSEG
jgi:hypothetical protein